MMVVYGVTSGRGYIWCAPELKGYYPIDPEPSMSYMLLPGSYSDVE